MPLFNSARWVEDSVRSILEQDFRNIELIIVDNASLDDSWSICQRLASFDSRIRLYRNDQNIGANRNYALVLQKSIGQYFKWAAASDWCAPCFLSDCVGLLQKDEDVVLATGRTVLFSRSIEDGVPYNDDFSLLSDDASERFIKIVTSMRLNNLLNGVIRADVLKGLPVLGAFEGADNVLVAELGMHGKFQMLDKPMYYRRMTPATATKLKSDQEVSQHIDPTRKRPPRWREWRLKCAYFGAAVRSAPFGWSWLKAVGFSLRQFLWARNELAREVFRSSGHAS